MFVAIAIGYGRELIASSSENQFEYGGLTWILPLLRYRPWCSLPRCGFVAWYFTRSVIDDEELRVETGAIFKKSRKILRTAPVGRYHPATRGADVRVSRAAARRRCLCTTETALPTPREGVRLRDYLLTARHGQQASIRDLDQESATERLHRSGGGRSATRQVTPQRLIISFLLSAGG